jgi:hypothetical protein
VPRALDECQTQCTPDPEIHKAVEKLRSEGGLTPARADFLDVECGLAEIQDIFWEAASVRDNVEREVRDGSTELEAAKLTGCSRKPSGAYQARITTGGKGTSVQINLGTFRSKNACHSAFDCALAHKTGTRVIKVRCSMAGIRCPTQCKIAVQWGPDCDLDSKKLLNFYWPVAERCGWGAEDTPCNARHGELYPKRTALPLFIDVYEDDLGADWSGGGSSSRSGGSSCGGGGGGGGGGKGGGRRKTSRRTTSFGPTDVFVGIICGRKRQKRSLVANGFD